MLGISKNMTRLRQLYEMKKSLLDNTRFIDDEQKQEFEDLIKEIDSVEQKDYCVLLVSKMYKTKNNDEELKRLKELVELIEERNKSRIEMFLDFKNIFGRELDFAEDIKELNNLDRYHQKITYLESITNNEHIISENKELISDLSTELADEYDIAKENNKINKKLEEDLLNRIIVKTNINSNDSYHIISVIDAELVKFHLNMADILDDTNLLKEKLNLAKEESTKAKEKYHVAEISYNVNKEHGGNILENYRVLVEIKKEYYTNRYYEILLGICALVIPLKELNYDALVGKRYRLIKLLDERRTLRNELGINSYDRLHSLYNEVNEQCRKLLEQEENIDNIDNLEHRIARLTNEIDDLEKSNYEISNNIKKLDNSVVDNKPSKTILKPLSNEKNAVISVEDIPSRMNLEIINFKTKNVLLKVYELLTTKNKEVSKKQENIKTSDNSDDIVNNKEEEPSILLPVIEDNKNISLIDSYPTNPEITIEEVEKPITLDTTDNSLPEVEEPILSKEEDIFEDDNSLLVEPETTDTIFPIDINQEEPLNQEDLFLEDKEENNIDVGMVFPEDNNSHDDNLFWPQIEEPVKIELQENDLENTQELSLDEQVEQFLKNSN